LLSVKTAQICILVWTRLKSWLWNRGNGW